MQFLASTTCSGILGQIWTHLMQEIHRFSVVFFWLFRGIAPTGYTLHRAHSAYISHWLLALRENTTASSHKEAAGDIQFFTDYTAVYFIQNFLRTVPALFHQTHSDVRLQAHDRVLCDCCDCLQYRKNPSFYMQVLGGVVYSLMFP